MNTNEAFTEDWIKKKMAGSNKSQSCLQKHNSNVSALINPKIDTKNNWDYIIYYIYIYTNTKWLIKNKLYMYSSILINHFLYI